VDCLDALMTRRSIRQYLPKPLTDHEIDVLLRAAMAAPSAGNQQPWRFVLVTEFARLAELSQATPYSKMIAAAPLAIAVCGDTAAQKHPGYWVQDCSAAVQNMLVAAQAIGLGGVWIGVHPVAEREDAVRRICGIPDEIVPLALVAVGYPAEVKPPADRYEPSYVHHESWNG
jgi:nitroreductase